MIGHEASSDEKQAFGVKFFWICWDCRKGKNESFCTDNERWNDKRNLNSGKPPAEEHKPFSEAVFAVCVQISVKEDLVEKKYNLCRKFAF